MRKLVFIACLLFILPILVAQSVVSQTQTIDSKALQIIKSRTVNIKVEAKRGWTFTVRWPVHGVIWKTNYVLTNSHIIPDPADGNFTIKVNGKKAEIVKDFNITKDLLVLHTETVEFEPLPFKTDFQIGDSSITVGKYGVSLGKIIYISDNRFFVYTSNKTLKGDSGSGVWSPDGQLIGLRSGNPTEIEKVKIEKGQVDNLTEIRNTGVRFKNLLTDFF